MDNYEFMKPFTTNLLANCYTCWDLAQKITRHARMNHKCTASVLKSKVRMVQCKFCLNRMPSRRLNAHILRKHKSLTTRISTKYSKMNKPSNQRLRRLPISSPAPSSEVDQVEPVAWRILSRKIRSLDDGKREMNEQLRKIDAVTANDGCPQTPPIGHQNVLGTDDNDSPTRSESLLINDASNKTPERSESDCEEGVTIISGSWSIRSEFEDNDDDQTDLCQQNNKLDANGKDESTAEDEETTARTPKVSNKRIYTQSFEESIEESLRAKKRRACSNNEDQLTSSDDTKSPQKDSSVPKEISSLVTDDIQEKDSNAKLTSHAVNNVYNIDSLAENRILKGSPISSARKITNTLRRSSNDAKVFKKSSGLEHLGNYHSIYISGCVLNKVMKLGLIRAQDGRFFIRDDMCENTKLM